VPRLTAAPSSDADRSSQAEPPRKRKKRRTQSGQIAAQHLAEPPPPPPPKPTDLEQLKVGMTHLARKRFDEAIATFRKMLDDNPGDPEAGKWLYVSQARLSISRGDETGAEACYRRAIEVDEQNAEARKYLREVAHARRLAALPFGRYFVKKRPTEP
jgi:tetratricopeptide (TPR) repeat protein